MRTEIRGMGKKRIRIWNANKGRGETPQKINKLNQRTRMNDECKNNEKRIRLRKEKNLSHLSICLSVCLSPSHIFP